MMELNVWYDIDVEPDKVHALYKVKFKNNDEHTAIYNRVLKIFQPNSSKAYYDITKIEGRKNNIYNISSVFFDKPIAWKVIEIYAVTKSKELSERISRKNNARLR
jgi:hypothetical protein